MREERLIFETRRKEYIRNARLALEVVNTATGKFNSYGSCFGIWDKECAKRKFCKEFVSDTLREKLERDLKSGVCGENLKRHEYRYGLIGNELLRQAIDANEALKAFGRFMVYDEDNYIFKLNLNKLDRWATQYADNVE